MSDFWYWVLMIGILLAGIAVGWLMSQVSESRRSDERDRQRARTRAVLGVEERDAPQRGARGTARLHTAEYREKDPEHGMDEGPDSA